MFHKELKTRWYTLSLFEQMANIGMEVSRSLSWKQKNNSKMSINAFYRALELIDMTVSDIKNKTVLKELLRIREELAENILGNNIYNTDQKSWEKYFYYYNLAARKKR